MSSNPSIAAAPPPIDRKLLEYGILRQMDIQNLEYPAELPVHDQLPTALEFAQLVYRNVPVKFSGTAADGAAAASKPWATAAELWGQHPTYLRDTLATTTLAVAETPLGNADAPLDGRYFVQPHVRPMSGEAYFSLPCSGSSESQANPTSISVFDNSCLPSADPGSTAATPDQNSASLQPSRLTRRGTPNKIVRYMQSQDNNFPREFPALAHDAPHSLAFADTALGAPPVAVNLWLGRDLETVSRLHNDNYENIYVQVSGTKEIFLIPPGDAYTLDERFLTPACYDADMNLVVDAAGHKVLFPTVDPNDPTTHNEVFRRHALVYRVVLEPGDMLYLPALWYHQVGVASVGAANGTNLSLNYWYNSAPSSGLWMKWDYVRLTALLLRGYHDDDYFDLDSDDDG
jgi:jumonji domain-containing protein 7